MTYKSSDLRDGLAWFVLALATLFCSAGLVLMFVRPANLPEIENWTPENVIDAVCNLTFTLVGALIVSRRGKPGSSAPWVSSTRSVSSPASTPLAG